MEDEFPLKTRIVQKTLTVLAMVPLAASALAQRAETGLLGINLFDKSTRVLQKFGTPDEILPVTLGGGAQFGGGGGGAGAPGAPAGRPGAAGAGGGGRAAGGGGAAGGQLADFMPPLSSEDDLRQFAPGGRQSGGSSPFGPGGPPPGVPNGGGPPPGVGGPGGGRPGAGAPPAGGGAAGAPPAAGAGTRVTFTRLVYNKKSSKYAFIIDRLGRVVQIEAIGLKDPMVKTRNGVTFGANFKTVVGKYANPDGYEIAGDNMFVKYLTRGKVAFRFARLAPKKPQVVVGVVVAAGKS